MAAQAGATLAELMNRLGHSDVRAALLYQHASADRDAILAQRLSELAMTQAASSERLISVEVRPTIQEAR